MKKLIFLAAIAAFMLHGCADEPIAAPVDENNIETRAIVGSDITVSPAGFGDYLLTGVEYSFTSPFSWYSVDPFSADSYVRWKIGDTWEFEDCLYPIDLSLQGKLIHTFDTPGTYTVRSGRFPKTLRIGLPPTQEHVRTFIVVDSFVTISENPPAGSHYFYPFITGSEYRFKATTVAPTGYSASWTVKNSNGVYIYPIINYSNNVMGIVFPANGTYTITVKFGPYIEESRNVQVGGGIIVGPVKP